MKTKKTEVPFDPKALVARVEQFASHAKSKKPMPLLRISEVPIPPPVEALNPNEILSIRTRLGVSQAVFAALLNVPKRTTTSWETGARKPSGAALKLLQLVKDKPELLISA